MDITEESNDFTEKSVDVIEFNYDSESIEESNNDNKESTDSNNDNKESTDSNNDKKESNDETKKFRELPKRVIYPIEKSNPIDFTKFKCPKCNFFASEVEIIANHLKG